MWSCLIPFEVLVSVCLIKVLFMFCYKRHYISTTLELYIHSYPIRFSQKCIASWSNCISVRFYDLENCAPRAKLRVSPPEIPTVVMKRVREQTFLSMTVFCSTRMTILHPHFLWCYSDNITGFSHLLDCILMHKELWLCRLIKIIISIKKQASQRSLEKCVGGSWCSLLPFHPPIWSHFFPLNVTVVTSPETFKKLEEYSVNNCIPHYQCISLALQVYKGTRVSTVCLTVPLCLCHLSYKGLCYNRIPMLLQYSCSQLLQSGFII